MSCLIALEESGLAFQGIEVDWENPNAHLEELERLNPQGSVPLLINEDGRPLTQNAAILEIIADRAPGSNLLAPVGTWARAETLSWLSWVASDLHKSFSPLFAISRISQNASAQDDIRKWAIQNIRNQLALADSKLAQGPYLLGETFTIADTYLFVVAEWGIEMDLDYSEFPHLLASLKQFRSRRSVKKAYLQSTA